MILPANDHSPNLKLICSLSAHPNNETRPLFFYHLQKTGGISFGNPLMTAFVTTTQQNTSAIRVTNQEELSRVQSSTCRFLTSPQLAYGCHRSVADNFLLTALFREPFSRIVSHYSYLCMRQQTPPNDGEFERFFQNPENINLIAKRLHPDALTTEQHDADSVINNLDTQFHSFAYYTQTNELLSYYLSLYKLPNFLSERVNVTLDQYRYNGDRYKDDILQLNQDDTKVCEFVKNNPRIPTIAGQKKTEMSNRTIIIHEYEKLKATKQTAKLVETEQLIRYLQSHGNRQITSQEFFAGGQ